MRASGYAKHPDGWYCEPPWIVDALLTVEQFRGRVWDGACGAGNIPRRFAAHGLDAVGSDLRDRGFGTTGLDFLTVQTNVMDAQHIVSNPPFDFVREWVDHGLALVPGKVCVLARLAFLESAKRAEWFQASPFARIWVSSRRVSMPPGGSGVEARGGTIPFAWFVWDRAHAGKPEIGWI